MDRSAIERRLAELVKAPRTPATQREIDSLRRLLRRPAHETAEKR